MDIYFCWGRNSAKVVFEQYERHDDDDNDKKEKNNILLHRMIVSEKKREIETEKEKRMIPTYDSRYRREEKKTRCFEHSLLIIFLSVFLFCLSSCFTSSVFLLTRWCCSRSYTRASAWTCRKEVLFIFVWFLTRLWSLTSDQNNSDLLDEKKKTSWSHTTNINQLNEEAIDKDKSNADDDDQWTSYTHLRHSSNTKLVNR